MSDKQEQVTKAAQEYIQAIRTIEAATEHRDNANARLLKANLDMQKAKDILLGSIEPRCGSATKPSRRLFDAKGQDVLIVEWDDRSGRPAVYLERMG